MFGCYNQHMENHSPAPDISTTASPLVIGFIEDFKTRTGLEAAAQHLGYRLVCLADPQQLETLERRAPALRKVGSAAATSSGAALLEWVTGLRPALIILDLEHPRTPWQNWIPLLKTDPSTRRIPVICLENQVTECSRAAEALGADRVLSRRLFLQDPVGVLEKSARPAPVELYQASCREPLSPTARHGLELFNRGDYFEAHEVLEAAWNADDTPGRELYRALLQVAVAYLQIERGNYRGAVKMFLRLRQWLEPFPDRCRGIDLHRLRREVQEVYQRVLDLGPEQIATFERELLRPVYFDIPNDEEN